MIWDVIIHPEFEREFLALPEEVQDLFVAELDFLMHDGPQLGRPKVDTLNGSKYAKMKELRFQGEGCVWRFAFAFDPERRAVMLCGGDKSHGAESRFYNKLIKVADERLKRWEEKTKEERLKKPGLTP